MKYKKTKNFLYQVNQERKSSVFCSDEISAQKFIGTLFKSWA